jgi:4-hydroxybenzoate polyprenyltransferase
MKTIFKRSFDFLIYSNLFIAIAAVLFTVQAQIQLGLKPDWHPYLFLILFATLFEYNLHKFVAVFFYKHALEESKFHWIAKNLKLFYFIVFSSVAGLIITVFFAKVSVLITLFPLGVITVLYSFPVYKRGVKLFRLREVPFVKIFIISFVWSATSILLPLVQAELQIEGSTVLLLILERFLFVFSITVPFDIRDMEGDRKIGLRTLPLIIGEKRAVMSANISLILFVLISAVHYTVFDQTYLLYSFVLSTLITWVVLNNNYLKLHRHYHYGILDGMMTLQALLTLMFYYLNG